MVGCYEGECEQSVVVSIGECEHCVMGYGRSSILYGREWGIGYM